jgi:hypothetical protein
MSAMSFHTAAAMLSIAVTLAGATVALAQDPSSPNPTLLPPPPPPPPPPTIEVPKVPKMDEIPTSPKAALPRRGSFGDRVRGCIEEGAAMGLGPNERAAYSRACANAR